MVITVRNIKQSPGETICRFANLGKSSRALLPGQNTLTNSKIFTLTVNVAKYILELLPIQNGAIFIMLPHILLESYGVMSFGVEYNGR